MSIRRVCFLDPGTLCKVYSYPFAWMKEGSVIEPEEYLIRTDRPGRWNSVADIAQMFEFLRGDTGTLVTLDGRVRVTTEE